MAKVENENMKVSERRKIKSGVKCCVFVGLLRENREYDVACCRACIRTNDLMTRGDYGFG
jgi:hypothetical protein